MGQSEFAPTRVKLWVGTDNAILLKIATYDRQGQKLLSQSFTSIELDLSVPGSLFVFTRHRSYGKYFERRFGKELPGRFLHLLHRFS